MKRVFYTDGSVSHNGKPNAKGGYAWVEVTQDESFVVNFESGNSDGTGIVPTNNRMELMAVIEALGACLPEDTITIKSDSAYVVNCINKKWYSSWIQTGKTSTGGVPMNLDLWAILLRRLERLKSVKFVHVKGHADNTYNILCDKLAGEARIQGGE